MQKISKDGFKEFWASALRQLRSIRSLAGASILAALGIIMKPLSIMFAEIFRVSFSFLATGVSGYLYGPITAGFAAAVMDVLGYLVKPDGGFFPGFTVSAFISGFIYGCWLYRRPVRVLRVLGACATNSLLISFLLNPIWLRMMYGESYVALSGIRIIGNLVVLPINTLLLYLVLMVVEKNKRFLVKAT